MRGSDGSTVLWDMISPPNLRYTRAQALANPRNSRLECNVLPTVGALHCHSCRQHLSSQMLFWDRVHTAHLSAKVLTRKFTTRGIYATPLMQ